MVAKTRAQGVARDGRTRPSVLPPESRSMGKPKPKQKKKPAEKIIIRKKGPKKEGLKKESPKKEGPKNKDGGNEADGKEPEGRSQAAPAQPRDEEHLPEKVQPLQRTDKEKIQKSARRNAAKEDAEQSMTDAGYELEHALQFDLVLGFHQDLLIQSRLRLRDNIPDEEIRTFDMGAELAEWVVKKLDLTLIPQVQHEGTQQQRYEGWYFRLDDDEVDFLPYGEESAGITDGMFYSDCSYVRHEPSGIAREVLQRPVSAKKHLYYRPTRSPKQNVRIEREEPRRHDFAPILLEHNEVVHGIRPRRIAQCLRQHKKVDGDVNEWSSHGIRLTTPFQKTYHHAYYANLLEGLNGPRHQKTFWTTTNLCGTSVHVTRKEGFDLATLQHLAYILVMYEDQINKLFPPHRRPDINELAPKNHKWGQYILSNKRIFSWANRRWRKPIDPSLTFNESEQKWRKTRKRPKFATLEEIRHNIFEDDMTLRLLQIAMNPNEEYLIPQDRRLPASIPLRWTERDYLASFQWSEKDSPSLPATIEFRQLEGEDDLANLKWWVVFCRGLVRLAHHMAHNVPDPFVPGAGTYPFAEWSDDMLLTDLFDLMNFPQRGRERLQLRAVYQARRHFAMQQQYRPHKAIRPGQIGLADRSHVRGYQWRLPNTFKNKYESWWREGRKVRTNPNEYGGVWPGDEGGEKGKGRGNISANGGPGDGGSEDDEDDWTTPSTPIEHRDRLPRHMRWNKGPNDVPPRDLMHIVPDQLVNQPLPSMYNVEQWLYLATTGSKQDEASQAPGDVHERSGRNSGERVEVNADAARPPPFKFYSAVDGSDQGDADTSPEGVNRSKGRKSSEREDSSGDEAGSQRGKRQRTDLGHVASGRERANLSGPNMADERYANLEYMRIYMAHTQRLSKLPLDSEDLRAWLVERLDQPMRHKLQPRISNRTSRRIVDQAHALFQKNLKKLSKILHAAAVQRAHRHNAKPLDVPFTHQDYARAEGCLRKEDLQRLQHLRKKLVRLAKEQHGSRAPVLLYDLGARLVADECRSLIYARMAGPTAPPEAVMDASYDQFEAYMRFLVRILENAVLWSQMTEGLHIETVFTEEDYNHAMLRAPHAKSMEHFLGVFPVVDPFAPSSPVRSPTLLTWQQVANCKQLWKELQNVVDLRAKAPAPGPPLPPQPWQYPLRGQMVPQPRGLRSGFGSAAAAPAPGWIEWEVWSKNTREVLAPETIELYLTGTAHRIFWDCDPAEASRLAVAVTKTLYQRLLEPNAENALRIGFTYEDYVWALGYARPARPYDQIGAMPALVQHSSWFDPATRALTPGRDVDPRWHEASQQAIARQQMGQRVSLPRISPLNTSHARPPHSPAPRHMLRPALSPSSAALARWAAEDAVRRLPSAGVAAKAGVRPNSAAQIRDAMDWRNILHQGNVVDMRGGGGEGATPERRPRIEDVSPLSTRRRANRTMARVLLEEHAAVMGLEGDIGEYGEGDGTGVEGDWERDEKEEEKESSNANSGVERRVRRRISRVSKRSSEATVPEVESVARTGRGKRVSWAAGVEGGHRREDHGEDGRGGGMRYELVRFEDGVERVVEEGEL